MMVDSEGSRSSAKSRSTARLSRDLTEAGLAWLRTNQQTVNSLNVFPCLMVHRDEHGADHGSSLERGQKTLGRGTLARWLRRSPRVH